MTIVLLVLLGLGLLLAATWGIGVWYLNDFSVRRERPNHYKHVLVVFPHPDDETNVAGLLWLLHRQHIPVTLVVLTKGECGTPDAHMELALKQVRSEEMRRVSQLLGAQALLLADFGDGQVAKHRKLVHEYIEKVLGNVEPDLVITYDLAGLYGHEDHIACSEIVTELVKSKYPQAALWYSTIPAHLLRTEHLPTYMAKDPNFAKRRACANVRVPTGRGVAAKVRAIYLHKSQRQSFQKSVPGHLPIWFVHSMFTNEYFEKVQ